MDKLRRQVLSKLLTQFVGGRRGNSLAFHPSSKIVMLTVKLPTILSLLESDSNDNSSSAIQSRAVQCSSLEVESCCSKTIN